jgi:hypothetical protein
MMSGAGPVNDHGLVRGRGWSQIVRLSVGVPPCVGEDPGLVELDPVAGAQDRHRGHPPAVGATEVADVDAFAAVLVVQPGRQQLQLADRRVRVAGPDLLLLGDDDLCRGLGDR